MKHTQEQIDQATVKIESHLKDIGILNNFVLLNIDEVEGNEDLKNFVYQISNPTFKTTIQIEYDFNLDQGESESSPSFSWMDYKKITE